jgi:hypothetical protein
MAVQQTLRGGPIPALGMDQSARDSLSLHWSGILAGLFVALLTYFALMSLGLAFGASAIKDNFQTDDTFRGLAIGAGVWTVVSVLVSLFLGSYASGRASGIIATRIGYTQGAVITALFFGIMVSQIGASVGIFTRTLTNISSSAVGAAVSGVVRSPRIGAIIEDNLGNNLNLKVPPGVFVNGMAQRLMRGDTDSARNYLMAQTGIPRAEAQQRIDDLNAKFKVTLADIGQKTSEAASRLGWAAFVTIVLGAIASMLGGGTGAMVNLRKPLDRVDERAMRRIPAYT